MAEEEGRSIKGWCCMMTIWSEWVPGVAWLWDDMVLHGMVGWGLLACLPGFLCKVFTVAGHLGTCVC